MLKNLSRILPFFIVTLLSIGGVELLYKFVERYLAEEKSLQQSAEAKVSRQPSKVEQIEKHHNYQVILDRNLFKSYLKDEVKKEEEKENPLEGLEETTLDLVLMGTITGFSQNSRRAFILDKNNRKQGLYYEGDEVQGAIVKEILRAKVILTFNGTDEILDMSEASKEKPKVAKRTTPQKRRFTPVKRSQPTKVRHGRPQRRIVPSRTPAPTDDATVPGNDQSGDGDDSDGDLSSQAPEVPSPPDPDMQSGDPEDLNSGREDMDNGRSLDN